MPEIKGSTRVPVLQHGNKTDRGLAPSVNRVKYVSSSLSLLSFVSEL
jgi:hypothetical protein